MKRALEGLDGVTSARVELKAGLATIDYREGSLSDIRAIDAIQKAVALPGLRRWLARLFETQHVPFIR